MFRYKYYDTVPEHTGNIEELPNLFSREKFLINKLVKIDDSTKYIGIESVGITSENKVVLTSSTMLNFKNNVEMHFYRTTPNTKANYRNVRSRSSTINNWLFGDNAYHHSSYSVKCGHIVKYNAVYLFSTLFGTIVVIPNDLVSWTAVKIVVKKERINAIGNLESLATLLIDYRVFSDAFLKKQVQDFIIKYCLEYNMEVQICNNIDELVYSGPPIVELPNFESLEERETFFSLLTQ